MAEVLVTMFDLETLGTHREPPPKRVMISNVFDHLACEGLMTRLSEIEQRNSTTAQRTVILNAAINLARAIEKAQRILTQRKIEHCFIVRDSSRLQSVASSLAALCVSRHGDLPM